jgi:hypothetical protein
VSEKSEIVPTSPAELSRAALTLPDFRQELHRVILGRFYRLHLLKAHPMPAEETIQSLCDGVMDLVVHGLLAVPREPG